MDVGLFVGLGGHFNWKLWVDFRFQLEPRTYQCKSVRTFLITVLFFDVVLPLICDIWDCGD